MYLLNDIQQFTKATSLLFESDKLEARIQRRYMDQGMYDLCIDDGVQVIQIKGQEEWSKVQPGTKVALRVILRRGQIYNVRKYKCPRCKTWNDPEWKARSIDW